jgi:hypothetical protein
MKRVEGGIFSMVFDFVPFSVKRKKKRNTIKFLLVA